MKKRHTLAARRNSRNSKVSAEPIVAHASRPTINDDDQIHYDFVIATPTASSEYRRELHDKLREAGFEIDVFDSHVLKGDEAVTLCRIALPPDRCMEFADAVQAPARLDPLKLKTECEKLKHPITFKHRAKDGTSLDETSRSCSYYPPFLHIFCPLHLEKSDLFLPFIAHNRAKLQLRMLSACPAMSAAHRAARGAGVNLQEMQSCSSYTNHQGAPRVATLMLLHEALSDTNGTRHKLLREWVKGPWRANLPWNVPIHRIREYFGDATGFYFIFLSTFAAHCLPIGVLGTLVMAIHVTLWWLDWFPDFIRHMPSSVFAPLNVLAMTVCILHYRRKQAQYAKEWGCYAWTSGKVHVRSAFKGIPQVDPVDGHIIKDFPQYLRRRRQAFSWLVIILMMCLVMVVVSFIFAFRAWCWRQPDDSLWRTYGVALAVLLNVLQVLLFNRAYSSIAKWLTEQENWKTDSQYSDNLVMKLFLAQFFNTFISIYYVAFVKIMDGVDPCRITGGCFYDLFFSVAPIYISNALSSFGQQVVLPFLLQRRIRRRTGSDYGRGPEEHIMARRQFIELTDYDNIEGPIDDFMESALQFSFLACFGAAFPMSPLVCFLLNMGQLRQDGYKMLCLHRRPLAVEVQGIGIWVQLYFTVISISIPTNVGILVFTSSIFKEVDTYVKTWVFVVGSLALYFATRLMIALYPAESDAVLLQLRRQELFTDRVVLGLEDDGALDEAEAEECDTDLVFANHPTFVTQKK